MFTNENSEKERLQQKQLPWKLWGPYLSERQWGTVREDYSHDGNAWNYFSHDQARSRAYRWGEDGIGGICDDHMLLCFAIALWNGKDPILKERMFGLTNSEGNHGEDVKEYYFYLDSTPTHSYLKYLYKYPQNAYPYDELVETNSTRSKEELEYELLDTGIFDEDRYFDVFVEYAKNDPQDILIKISISNRGPEAAPLHLLPTLWFRNTWTVDDTQAKPLIEKKGNNLILARHKEHRIHGYIGDYYLYAQEPNSFLFTENETNQERLFNSPNNSPYVKDGINDYLVEGKKDCVNPRAQGTKAAAHYILNIEAQQTTVVQLRLVNKSLDGDPFANFDKIFEQRINDADLFYDSITPPNLKADKDKVNVMRQALSSMLWTKQYFYYDVDKWLEEHGAYVDKEGIDEVRNIRNSEWSHMFNDDIISMPDKWEYPWFAAWDLAFHMIPLSIVDPDFSKAQLDLMLRNDYLHPNGQIPAYEWNFSDVNPPVHAWATIQTYITDKIRNNGQGDTNFLKYAFSKLLINFTWWVNRKDSGGNNVFQGGFLGLDNIGLFDRSSPLPTGGYLEQADGTSWMVFFSQQMLRIAAELALEDPLYEEYVSKFFEHTMWIAGAMDRIGENQDELWDEEDGFFYDVLCLPDGSSIRLKVRSMVGLLPLMAVAVFSEDDLVKLPNFTKKARLFLERHSELAANIHLPSQRGVSGHRMLSIVNEAKLRRILTRMLDENEFLSPYGIRSLSRYYKDNPFIFDNLGQNLSVNYLPGDSNTGMFGGNSNWRGPVWMPVNLLLYGALLRYYQFYGDSFTIECPTGSGKYMTLFEVAKDLGERLGRLFLKNDHNTRPVYGNSAKFQNDPHWQDLILYYEYFHGDDGSGIGASHQTGWTGCVARIIQLNSTLTKEMLLGRHDNDIAKIIGGF
jgi:hypothetical protein